MDWVYITLAVASGSAFVYVEELIPRTKRSGSDRQTLFQLFMALIVVVSWVLFETVSDHAVLSFVLCVAELGAMTYCYKLKSEHAHR